jgi:hypothetical protein
VLPQHSLGESEKPFSRRKDECVDGNVLGSPASTNDTKMSGGANSRFYSMRESSEHCATFNVILMTGLVNGGFPILTMATKMFAETLVNTKHSTRLLPDSRSYTSLVL